MPLGFWHRLIANKEPVFIACCSTQAIFVGDGGSKWWMVVRFVATRFNGDSAKRERGISKEKKIVKWNVLSKSRHFKSWNPTFKWNFFFFFSFQKLYISRNRSHINKCGMKVVSWKAKFLVDLFLKKSIF